MSDDVAAPPELDGLVDIDAHPLHDPTYAAAAAAVLGRTGALVLDGFFTAEVVEAVRRESLASQHLAFHATGTHNVWLTATDPSLPPGHVVNRQVVSTKGCITDDQIPADSPLRAIYGAAAFRTFLCRVLGVDEIHPYDDDVSSINVHYHADGQELGWHFDNSSFAVTMLIQAPEEGGEFEYVTGLRDSGAGTHDAAAIAAVLDGAAVPARLEFGPGALVLFRGRDALHRITPSRGPRTRVLVVFAYNTEPGIGLGAEARATFYGR